MKGYMASIQAARQVRAFVGSEWTVCMIYLGKGSHSLASRCQSIGNSAIAGQLMLQPRFWRIYEQEFS